MAKSTSRVAIETMESRVLFSVAQLTDAVTGSTLPANLSDQATAAGKVTVTLTNDSGTTQKLKKVEINIDASAGGFDPSVGSAVILGYKVVTLSLVDGQSKPYVVPVKIKAGELADTTYNLYGLVDDSPEDEAITPAGPSLTVAPPVITLAETQSIPKLPATLASGAKLTVTDKLSIANSGTDELTTPLSIILYATTDGVATDGTEVATLTYKGKIPAGKTGVAPLQVKKVVLPDGTYTLIAQVTQSNGTVTDSTASSTIVVGTGGTSTGGGGGGGGGGTTAGLTGTITDATVKYSPDPLAGYAQYATEIDTTLSLDNTGTSIAGPDTVTLFSSTSATFDSTATQVGQITLSPSIGTGKSETLRADFGLSSGPTYDETDLYIFVQLTPSGATTPAFTAAYGKTVNFDGNIV
jgi:hypothetical protein